MGAFLQQIGVDTPRSLPPIVLAGFSAVLLLFPASSASASPPDAELITVTPTSFVATWTTSTPADTTVCVGRVGEREQCRRTEDGTRFHRAEVRGLEPGMRYSYSLRSGGVPQLSSPTNPGTFTTLVRPPGRHLFDFAVLSDVHIGEGCSGTAATLPVSGSVPPCFETEEGDPGHPYSSTMARAAIDELNSRELALAILNADNTSHAKYSEVAAFRDISAELEAPMHLARGSHDRANQNPPDPRCGADNDCFRELLFPERAPGRIFYSFNHRRHHFVALDSAEPASGMGEIDAEQLKFLRRDLARARRAGRKSFIFLHHPVSEYANTTSFPPVIFGVTPQRGGQDFLAEVGRHPDVVGVINSHTHRNYVSYSPQSGADTVFFENGPTKEYPGGYGIVRVYRGGYVRTFHRLSCDFCREWIATTRDQYFGLYPLYTLGTLSARNFTHVYDCGVPTPPPSPPFGHESATGGDTARIACRSGGDPEPPDSDGQDDRDRDERNLDENGRGDREFERRGDRPQRTASPRAAASPSADDAAGDIPFTGLAIASLLLVGCGLLATGLFGRLRATLTRRARGRGRS